MEIWICVLLITFSLLIIVFSGNWMVSSATKISYLTGIPQALVGATIVSLATTLPELNVVIFSAMGGHSGLAVGNTVGSIIFNLTFIVGIVFLFTRNKITTKVMGKNFFIMLVTIIIIYILCLFDIFNKWAGMILLTIFLFFFINNIIDANKKGVTLESVQEPSSNAKYKFKGKKMKLWLVVLSFCISSFFVSYGAKILVQNGERLARLMQISEHVIGVTVIAIGTSLPEVVTAISSIRQKSSGIALGNTIGANILSSTLLLGINAILEPNKLVLHSNITNMAIPLILISCLVIYIPLIFTTKRYRLQGILLLGIFVLYYITLVI